MEISDKILESSPFLLNEDNKKYWLIFTTQKSLNYLCSSERGKNWSKEKILLREETKSFTASFDLQKRIHVICKDSKNNILHLFQDNRKWESKVLMHKKKDKETGFFSLAAANTGTFIHLFYLTLDNSNNKWMLMHNMQKENLWETGKVIAGGSGQHENYAVVSQGTNSRIHMIKRCFENGNHLLYYQTLNPDTLIWTRPLLISGKYGNNQYPFLLEDCDNNIHVIWVLSSDNSHQVIYRKRSFGSWMYGGWLEPLVVKELENSYPPIPFLRIHNSRVNILCKQDNLIFRYSSSNKGNTWENIDKQNMENSYIVRYSEKPGLYNQEKYSYFLAKDFPPYLFVPELPKLKKESVPNLIRKKEDAFGSLNTYNNQKESDLEELNNINEQNALEKPEDLEGDFKKLEGYSDNLIKHASNLYDDRRSLEKTLEKKQKEFNMYYRTAEDRVDKLNREIITKENHLRELEKQLKNTIKNIDQKIQEEKKKNIKEKDELLKELKELKEENKKLQEKLKESNNVNNSLKDQLSQAEKEIANLSQHIDNLQKEAKENFWNRIKEKVFLKNK